MSEHSAVPWREVGGGIRNDGGYICIPVPPPARYPGQDERYERELAEWIGNMPLIVRAVNCHEELLEACRMAHRVLLQINDHEDYTIRTINDLAAILQKAEANP